MKCDISTFQPNVRRIIWLHATATTLIDQWERQMLVVAQIMASIYFLSSVISVSLTAGSTLS